MLTFLEKWKAFSLLLFRLGVGGIFVYHGFPKLFGNTARYMEYFANLGLPAYTTYFVGGVELLGGLMLVGGIFTRVVALLIVIEMAFAIWKVHLAEGVFSVSEYEYQLALALSLFVLSTIGAGNASLDHLLFRNKSAG